MDIHDYYDASEQTEEVSQLKTEPEISSKVSPFADSPYIMPFEEVSNDVTVKDTPVKKDHKWIRRFVASFLVICLVGGSCAATAYFMNNYWEKKTDIFSQVMNNKISALQQQLDDMEYINNGGGSVIAPVEGSLTPAQVYDKNVSAVVAVTTDSSMGSGFIISADGYIVSNQHVVDGAKSIYIVMHDGTEHKATLVGQDATNDVSLLKIESSELPYANIGSSDRIAVGAQVCAIGNPLGELTATLTVGYISAKDRVVATDGTTLNMLQTDAAINSGNSGGPLFDMYGNVIGITTAKYSGTSTSGATIEGIGFAIPIDDVMGIVSDLQEFGYVKTAYLGVSVRDVDATVIQNYGFPAGAYVVETVEGLSADQAGVKAKDIIVNIGGYTVTSVSELTRVLRKFDAGDTTTITVFRSGTEVNLSITMGEKPQDSATQQPESSGPSSGGMEDWWGNFPFFGQG